MIVADGKCNGKFKIGKLCHRPESRVALSRYRSEDGYREGSAALRVA